MFASPEALLHEAVWILSSKGSDRRLGLQALLQFQQLRVGLEIRALIDISDADGDGGCGLTGDTDAFI